MIRKQPPRLIAKISVRLGVPSCKLPICSLIFEKDFLENRYLFGEHIKSPGKLQKKERKEQIFSKTVSVAASEDK